MILSFIKCGKNRKISYYDFKYRKEEEKPIVNFGVLWVSLHFLIEMYIY